ncbi:trehalose-phosphatase [Methylocella sp.]|uniref:trehalose-phosphatase n=1 Tax=Methylocella sp. TaxID=1978226 RepID=UPI003784C3B2
MVEARVPALLPQGDFARVAPPGRSAYFFDVDGTLLNIRPRPEDVRADGALIALLKTLSAACGGALALVSGRAIDDVDRIFAPLVLPAAGLHGGEIRFPDGARTHASRGAVEAARPRLRAFAAARPGLRVEDKGAALALHYRQRPDLAADVLAFMESLVDRPELAVQPGKMVVELKRAGFSKATGAAALMAAAPFAGRLAAFVGDDLTDEAGFAFAEGLGGVSVRIAETDAPTVARFRIASPEDFRAELARAAALKDAPLR